MSTEIDAMTSSEKKVSIETIWEKSGKVGSAQNEVADKTYTLSNSFHGFQDLDLNNNNNVPDEHLLRHAHR